MKIIVVLVAVVMATTCWTGVTAQDDVDSNNVTEFRTQFGNLDSETVEQMMGDLEGAGGSNDSAGYNPQTRSFFPIPFRRCEDGPFRRVVYVPGVFYWPPVFVYRCRGSCPNWSPCIARKQVTRKVFTAVYKRFNVWGKYIWILTSIRIICVKDDTCCECKQCSDITNYYECRKTAPCPDTTNPNTFCYWKPYRSWVNSTSVSPSIWGSCACCKRTLCEPLEFFDERRCQCRCIPIRCPGPLVQDPDTCKCVCPHQDINCGLKRKIDPKTCKCKCKFFWCVPPRVKNLDTCHCDCPKKKSCRRPRRINPATCRCVCPWIRCRYGYYQNPYTCKCVRRGYGR